jgi:HK97 family phage portal protein
MGFRDRLAQLIAPRSLEQKAQVQPIQGIFSLQQPNIPVYGDMTVRKATREGYKISIYVYRAVTAIIQAISGIPWYVEKNKKRVEDHNLEYLLGHPNKVMSGQILMELLFAHLLLPGNALWQPLIVGGEIRELWPVMPDLVKPVPSSVKGQWLDHWQVTTNQGAQYDVLPEAFIHFMLPDPSNPFWGIGPLMAAARTIDTDNEALDTQKISMQNRAMPDGGFETGPLTPEQFSEATRQIKEQYTDKLRRRAPWIVTGKYTQYSMTPVEMDFIASRLANKQDIAACFGLDPWWLGDRSGATYNNVAEAKKALIETTGIPLLDKVAATMNHTMLLKEGEALKYDLSGVAVLRDDYSKKIISLDGLWSKGVPMKECNRILELGLDEFEGWEQSYLPFSVTPVTAIETEPPEPKPAPVIVQNGGNPNENVPQKEEQTQGSQKPTGEVPEALKPFQKKIVNWSDEQKTLQWKRIDTRRQAYWPIVAKRVQRLYGAEGDAVAQAISGNDQDLKNQVKTAIESLRPQWEKTLTAIGQVVLEDFGRQTAQDLGAVKAWRFDAFSPAARHWLEEHVGTSTTAILGTNMDNVSKIIEDGFTANKTTVEIAKDLRGFYDENAIFNAMRTARTEVGSAAGYGSREAAKQSGVVKTKTWVSSRDDRVRDSHIELDNTTVDLDDAYPRVDMMYPGDPAGDPSEFIQCRCAEVYN